MGVGMRIPRGVEGLPKTRAALRYAAALHRGQVRKIDGAPFIVHPREVAELLYGAGAAASEAGSHRWSWPSARTSASRATPGARPPCAIKWRMPARRR